MSQPNVVPLTFDIISRFMQMTETDDSPYLYRKWAGISMVAGALERRVWTLVGGKGGEYRQTFPNMYIFLVGAPGVGKGVVNTVKRLWKSVLDGNGKEPAFLVGDDNLTKASMMDSMVDGIKSMLMPKGGGPPYEYHSMLVASEEFGVFFTAYDLSFVATLNSLWNGDPEHKERRRTGSAKQITLVNPLLNIIAGVQPVWMNSVFPPEAWGMGLCSRVIMVYAAEGEPIDPFATGMSGNSERLKLLDGLTKLSRLYGELRWEDDAQRMVKEWHLSKRPPVPTHSKLSAYCNRRTHHLIKLAMISSVSRTSRVGVIERVDVNRAFEWLFEAEGLMPDIFRSMIGQSDLEVVEELYHFVLKLYLASGKKPIPDNSVISFLIKRVPAEKIQKILEMADKANMVVRVASVPETYRPGDRREFIE